MTYDYLLLDQPSCQHIQFVYNDAGIVGYIRPSLKATLDGNQESAKKANYDFEYFEAAKESLGETGIVLQLLLSLRFKECGDTWFGFKLDGESALL